MATLTSDSGDVITFRIKTDNRSSIPYGYEPDRVDEQDLLGSARTMVTRLGYGSKEINMDIILDSFSNLQKLLSARSSTVTYSGSDYSLTITGDITNIGGHSMYETSIRLKAV